ncbi:MAG: N-acetyltransferase [Deltaproteobacteria bacterium]|nr:N-acetyltransferase [Deltaproteobacteria bacterium]
MIRKASIRDVRALHRLLSVHADRGELLARPLSDIYDHLRDFSVFEEGPAGPVVGMCALHVCWEDLAEIRSLGVDEGRRHRGIGTALVNHALAEARDLGVGRVFTLTYRPEFFGKLGFSEVDKASLPQKIWADCIRCVKFPNCDEIAMLKTLEGSGI